jgi:hypothetical protein
MGWLGRWVVMLVGALSCVGCAGGGGNVSFHDESIIVNGETRKYAVYTPQN